MKKIHFIGIAGIGMSGLADIHLAKGDIITGSDLKPNNLTDKLSGKGATIYKGHSAHNIRDDVDFVVKSSCIRDDNPEITRSKELGIPIVSRSEMLKNLIDESKFSMTVTGTHGKTTTSSLVACITDFLGRDPMVVVGGEVDYFNGNARFGSSGIVVAEVDESDGYFRNISTTSSIVTNIEKEHMDHFHTLENLISAYGEFIGRISPNGAFVFNGDDKILKILAASAKAKKVSFGIDGDFDVTCSKYTHKRSIEFELVMRGKKYGKVSSPLVGRHNIMNILAAIAVCTESGFALRGIKEAISLFKGVRRRFDLIADISGIKIFEDYAHHPTELRAVLSAARDYSQRQGRVIAIFQPHRYSRTRDLLREFSDCFYDSDILILTDIYSANEDILDEVKVGDICKAMDRDRFVQLDVVKKKAIPDFVAKIVKTGDIIFVLGAGDIRDISGELVKKIGDSVRVETRLC